MITDQLNRIWNQLLDLTAVFVAPNWADPVSWLPVLLLIGVVAPILTILVLAWLWYRIRKPGVQTEFADPRRAAELDAQGRPIFPVGEPYSPSEAMIYEPGATRAENGEELLVACPKCGLVRPAVSDTCGNCGLTFTLRPTTRSLRAAGPPPGGAAAA